ncbi:MAG: hypothetical protein AAGA28_06905 [Pseudomonadota bacterium]
MPRWMWFLPLAGLLIGGATLAYMMGVRASRTTETEVIERVAAAYVSEAGNAADRTDCRAVPAQSPGLWLVVICERQNGAGVEYFIDRFGRVADRKALGDPA